MQADNKKSIKKPEGKEPSVSLTIFSLKMSAASYITCYWILFDIELIEQDQKISTIVARIFARADNRVSINVEDLNI